MSLPRFSLAETTDLNDFLYKMGMKDVFDKRNDLSGEADAMTRPLTSLSSSQSTQPLPGNIVTHCCVGSSVIRVYIYTHVYVHILYTYISKYMHIYIHIHSGSIRFFKISFLFKTYFDLYCDSLAHYYYISSRGHHSNVI